MAIVVLTVLLTAIAPMIVLSVATRVQARRVELATQAAWSYVDAIRAGQTDAPRHIVYYDSGGTVPWAEFFTASFAPEPPPATPATALGACPSSATDYPYCQNPTDLSDTGFSLYCVDLDENEGCSTDSTKDMIVQAFRSTTTDPSLGSTDPGYLTPEADAQRGYLLAVRVYRADAFSDNTPLKSAGTDGDAGTTGIVTSGLGLRKVPLIEVTTEIPAGDGNGFTNLCDRLACD